MKATSGKLSTCQRRAAERGLVGEAERVFRARDVGPVVYVFLGGGGKAIKWYLPLLAILVEQVYVAEVGVVGLLQVWRHE